ARVEPSPDFGPDEVIRAGALASNEADQDPIDLAFLRAAREKNLLDGAVKALSFTPFSPKTRRTETIVETQGGRIRVIKGALRTVSEIAGLDAAAVAALETRANEG